jgi:PleD family two-component response regulator
MVPTAAQPLILVAVARAHTVATVLESHGYAVAQAPTATLAFEFVRNHRPDIVILDSALPEMPGIEVAALLSRDRHLGRGVPILMLASETPTPEQRVKALRAGVWDFLQYPRDAAELPLKLQALVQAKGNIDQAVAEGLFDSATGLYSQPALARRARELGALMGRRHGALACVVFALEPPPADPTTGVLFARTVRRSDVVGALSPAEFAIVAPATDPGGAVKLATRIGAALRDAIGNGGGPSIAANISAGYDAVANITYSPIDPVQLLARATSALRTGQPERDHPWVRRFEESATRTTPIGVVLEDRRAGV